MKLNMSSTWSYTTDLTHPENEEKHENGWSDETFITSWKLSDVSYMYEIMTENISTSRDYLSPVIHTALYSSEFRRIFCGVIGSLISLLMFSGQIISITILMYEKRLYTTNNYFIISLIIADLLTSIICVPVWTMLQILEYWPFSHALCVMFNIMDFT